MFHVNHLRVSIVALCSLLLAACGGGGGGGDGGGGGGGAAAGGGSATPPPAPVFPRFAVVASLNDDTVSSYTVDSDTGQLRLRDYALAGDGPVSVAVSPNQALVYVVNQNDNSVSAFSLSHTSGFLTPLPSGRGSPFAVGLTPTSVVVHPSGRFAYVTNSVSNDVTAIATNTSTGQLSPVPGSPFTTIPGGTNPQSITIDPSGRFAYVANRDTDNVSTFTIDATTGALRFVSTILAGDGPLSITIDPSGRFAYTTNSSASGNISAFRIDATTGALAAVAGSPFTVAPDGNGPRSVNIDPSGKFVYVANELSDNISAFAVDATTGALSPLSASATVIARNGPASLALTRDATPLGYLPKFAVAAGLSSTLAGGFIATHSVDATTGELIVANTVDIAPIPASVAVHPSGQLAYTANGSSNNVSTFRIATNTGRLTELGTAVAAGSVAAAIALDPSGRFAYVGNTGTATVPGSVSAYTVLASGALEPIDDNPLTPAIDNHLAGTAPVAVAVDPSGQFAYVANSGSNNVSVFFINRNTGALVNLATVAAGTSPASATVDPAGRFAYVANKGSATVSGSVSAYLINSASGRLTRIDADPVAAGIQDFDAGNGSTSVSVDASGRFLYVANQQSTSVSAYAIDATTGALSRIDANPILVGVQDFGAGTNPNSIVVDASGRFTYVTSASDILSFRINTRRPGSVREPHIGALLTGSAPLPTGNLPFSIAVTGVLE